MDTYNYITHQLSKLPCDEYLVRIASRQTQYDRIETHNEIFEVTPDIYAWYDDWYEGDEYVYLIGYIPISEISSSGFTWRTFEEDQKYD